MQIIIEGKLVETKDIWDIVYESDSRNVTVKVKIIDKPEIIIGRGIGYDNSPSRVSEIKEPYKKLYNELLAKWSEDRNDLPTYKL